jgi:hypothetical protein
MAVDAQPSQAPAVHLAPAAQDKKAAMQQFMAYASNVVETWPVWKQSLLGNTSAVRPVVTVPPAQQK